MKSYLLTENNDALVGMRLAGIRGEIIKSKEMLLQVLKEKMEDEVTGILIITTPVVNLGREEVMMAKLKSNETLIIEIPSANQSFDNDYITRYIRESIGVKF